jgi:histidinol-phosphate aminotransferase
MIGASSVQVPLTRDERQDLDAIAAAVTDRTRLIMLCNPNNPTGTAIRHAELSAFLDRVPGDVLVLIDEAYREFVRDPDVPDGVECYRDRPNVVVVRTFSKAYGLAALRVGYAVAHEHVARALRAVALPFGVNQFAQEAAIASLKAETELFDRVEAVTRERTRVLAALREQGWQPPASEGNFVWLRLGERSAEFVEQAARAGVVLRCFPDEGVRISIGEPAANDAFLRVSRGAVRLPAG